MRLFSVISRTLVGGGSYPSAEKQSVYSTAPADWAKLVWNVLVNQKEFLYIILPKRHFDLVDFQHLNLLKRLRNIMVNVLFDKVKVKIF